MISIITTVKDGEAFLADAFDAILAQTCRDFEICVHNDGSSDKTSEIIYKYSQIFTQASIPFLHSFESVSKG
jgi:glycosyltransferase involved in cell wall biosynthesis